MKNGIPPLESVTNLRNNGGLNKNNILLRLRPSVFLHHVVLEMDTDVSEEYAVSICISYLQVEP